MNKLSRREQILIYILVLLMVVVVGWYFMISPAMAKNTTLKQQRDNLEFELESKKAVYETNIDVNAAIKKAKDELVDYHNKFMSIMNEYEIDVYFSELAAEYNLTPVDLTINEASETEIKSFSVALQEAKAESNSKSETTSNKSEEKEENPKTLVANVQQKVAGSPTNIARYIGKISENTGVALTQLQYTYNRDSTKEYTILTYNLYMIEK